MSWTEPGVFGVKSSGLKDPLRNGQADVSEGVIFPGQCQHKERKRREKGPMFS